MELEFKLEKFEGPLDLLLHLIEKNKIDIYDIPISQITDQYMAYLNTMDEADPDVMSEFLVMASTLLDIKCKMLLPKEKNEEGEEIDPREELVERLLNHKLYHRLSQEIQTLHEEAEECLYREENLPREVQDYVPPVDYRELMGNLSLENFCDLYQDTIRRRKFRIDPVRSSFGRIEKEEIDLASESEQVIAYLNEHPDAEFRSLLSCKATKAEIVAAFLIILELSRFGKISLIQEEEFGPIQIVVASKLENKLGLEEKYG